MSDAVTAVKGNKAEERDGCRKDEFTYDEQKVLSKETVEPETSRQGEGEPWRHLGPNILGRGNSSAKALGERRACGGLKEGRAARGQELTRSLAGHGRGWVAFDGKVLDRSEQRTDRLCL